MMVCATSSEASIATTIGTATCTMKIEISLSSPKMIGRNTITVESVPASTASPTSVTPVSVASIGSAPFVCRWRKMLSVTTTALSTSRPIDSSMPIIVRMLSEKPRKYIAATVISSENGTARPDDQRGRPVAQEQEQHDQREARADQPGVAQLGERAP